MSGVGYNPLEEGDAFDAASLDDRFTVVVDFINDLPAWAVAEQGISFENVDGSILATLDGTVDTGVASAASFTNEWPGSGSDTYADPPTAPAAVEWNLLKNGATSAKLEWTAVGLGDAAGDFIAAILVLVNVERDILRRNTSNDVDAEYATVIALQWKDENGVWHTLTRTERHLSELRIHLATVAGPLVYGNHPDYRDMAIRTLITPADVAGKATEIAGVRVVVGINGDLDATAPAIVADNATAKIFQFNLTVIPIRGSDPD